jgi:hypothetical protein
LENKPGLIMFMETTKKEDQEFVKEKVAPFAVKLTKDKVRDRCEKILIFLNS